MKKLLLLILLIPCSLTAQEYLDLEIKAKGVNDVAFSPDKNYLVLNEGSNILFYHAGNKTLVKTLDDVKKDVNALSFSHDSKTLAVAGADKNVYLFDLETFSLKNKYSVHDQPVEFVKVLQNRNKVLSASKNKIALYDANSNKAIFTVAPHEAHISALAVNPDGSIAYAADQKGNIATIDLHDGKVLKTLAVSKKAINSIVVSPDSKLLVYGGNEGKIVLANVNDLNDQRYISDIRADVEHLQFSGDGKYIASLLLNRSAVLFETSSGIRRMELKGFSYQPLKLSISPDGKRMATNHLYDNKVALWDISSLNISPVFRFKDEDDKTAPQIYVANPPRIINDRVRVSQDLMDIRGSVIDESGVRQIKVNGIETPIRDNGNFVIHLPLSMGDNFITIEAMDVNDNIALKKFVISRRNLDGEEGYDPKKAVNYLFIVGINDYKYWPKLSNAVKDATDVAGTLMNMYNFEFSNVIMLRDEQATRNNIYKSMRSLIEKITPNDNLLIYFSGHGYYDELLNEGYWVPVDAPLDAQGEYLPNSSILKIVENINTQHTFLVADACFSGSLFSEQKRGYAENVEKYKSRWGLASGRLEEVSDGQTGTNSPFAQSFLKYLKENEKDKVAVSELVQFVKVKVAEVSDQTPIGNPLRTTGDEGGEFVFYKREE